MLHTISDGDLSVTVNTLGGSMTSLRYRGEERLWQGGSAWKGQDVVIFPIIGHAGVFRAKGETFSPRSHGVARYSEFTLKETGEGCIALSLVSDAETMKEYPYAFSLTVTYALDGDTLTVTYDVEGTDGVIPFYVGGHPGLYAPGGKAEISFENTERPVIYPVDGGEGVQSGPTDGFTADKKFFSSCKTFQMGSLTGGKIFAKTSDGYTYALKADCPVVAVWSNAEEGDYICLEPWWGINDFEGAPRDITLKPFMNFAGGGGKRFSYSLSICKE